MLEAQKMRCLIRRDGQVAHYNCELVFIHGQPHAVLEWANYPDGSSMPSVMVQLQNQFLHPLNWPDVQYMYEHEIEDPRGPG